MSGSASGQTRRIETSLRAVAPSRLSMTQTQTLTRPTPTLTAPPVQTTAGAPANGITQTLIEARDVSVFYGEHEAIKKVSLAMPRHHVIAMIGPSGCGKSTFLRSINRLNDLIP